MLFNDLKALADEYLSVLLEAFRALAPTKNRVTLDLFCIIEKEMLRRCQPTNIEDYTDDDLTTAMIMLTDAVDVARAGGAPDDNPAMQFLLQTITDLAGEVQSRGLVQQLQ
jgi:hypothetical protein